MGVAMYVSRLGPIIAQMLASGNAALDRVLGNFDSPDYRSPSMIRRYPKKLSRKGHSFRTNPAGSKLSRKVGRLTCRHPVGTHRGMK